MTNLTVINRKDIIKSIFKFLSICLLLFILLNLVNWINIIKVIILKEDTLKALLNYMIPGINKETLKEDVYDKLINNKEDIFKIGLKLELGMFDSLIKNDNTYDENNINEKETENKEENKNDILQAEVRSKYYCCT